MHRVAVSIGANDVAESSHRDPGLGHFQVCVGTAPSPGLHVVEFIRASGADDPIPMAHHAMGVTLNDCAHR